MKSSELEEVFVERLLEYSYLMQGGAYFGAVSRLAEIENCLPLLSKGLQAKWKERISKEVLSEDVLHELKIEIEKAIKKIKRILAFGTKWQYEELLLVWTIRIQIEMLLCFLSERHQLTECNFSLEDVDEAMIEVAKSKINKQNLQIATNLMKKNWGLPINSQWLEKAS
jgi:hypothetical protein